MAGILFVGLVAYPLLPVAPLPQVDFPTIQITATLPGGSPETMASSVAQPLERQFAQIPGIAQMTSTSSAGTAAVTIQFDLNRSIDGAANDVQAAINAASGQLPKNLPSPPTYRKVNPADSPILLLSATSDTLPLTDGQRRSRCAACPADQPDFRRRPGHASAASRSRRSASRSIRRNWSPRACRWKMCAARSRSRRSTARRAISTARRAAYTIYANDQLTASKDWNDVIIAYRNGGPLRIRDIGQAVSGPEDAKTGGLGRTENAACSSWSTSSPAPTSSRPSTRSRRSCRGWSRRSPRQSEQGVISDRTQTRAARASRMSRKPTPETIAVGRRDASSAVFRSFLWGEW